MHMGIQESSPIWEAPLPQRGQKSWPTLGRCAGAQSARVSAVWGPSGFHTRRTVTKAVRACERSAPAPVPVGACDIFLHALLFLHALQVTYSCYLSIHPSFYLAIYPSCYPSISMGRNPSVYMGILMLSIYVHGHIGKPPSPSVGRKAGPRWGGVQERSPRV
jgi:hypothetical protein